MSDQSNDFSMAYHDSCDRIALLLIHGYPLSGDMWQPQLEDLADLARVVAPDLRGHGRSDAVTGPYTMSMLANDCAGLLDYLGIEGPVVVCGLSMGGYVALEFYRQYRGRVAGLILAATRAGADTAEAMANRDKSAETAQREGVMAVVDGLLPKLLSPKTYDADPELVEFLKEMMASTSVEGVVGALQGMKDRPDSTPMLAEIDVPTLIIHGADDAIIPASEAEAMHAAIADSLLVVLPDAGHMVNLEQPDLFNEAVADFLESLEGED